MSTGHAVERSQHPTAQIEGRSRYMVRGSKMQRVAQGFMNLEAPTALHILKNRLPQPRRRVPQCLTQGL
jgi:hypothetical protein